MNAFGPHERAARVAISLLCGICVCGAFEWSMQGFWAGGAAYLALITIMRLQTP